MYFKAFAIFLMFLLGIQNQASQPVDITIHRNDLTLKGKFNISDHHVSIEQIILPLYRALKNENIENQYH